MFLAQQKLIWLLSVVSVFLVFYKLKSGYFLHRRKAVMMMAYGCSLLIFGTVIGLVGNMGLLGAEYSKSMVFFILESMVGYTGGWVLMILGIALWLPYNFSISTCLHSETKKVKLYENISRLSAYGNGSATTFRKIAEAVMKHHDYQGASLHVVDKQNQLSLFSSVGLTERSKRLISSVKSGLHAKVYKTGEIFKLDEQIRINHEDTIETTSGPVVDALAVPVDFCNKRIGVLTVYTDHPGLFSQEDLRTLEVACEHVGLMLYKEGMQRSNNSQKAFRDFISVILKTCRSNDNLNTHIIRLGRLLRQLIEFDSIHLYLLGNGPSHILDFNLRGGGSVIVEKGYFNDFEYKPVRWVLANKRGLALPGDAFLISDNFKPRENYASFFTPIVVRGKVVGVISLSVNGKYKFSQNEIVAVNAIANVLSGVILHEINESITAETLDRSGAIRFSLEKIFEQQNSSNILNELAKIIVEKTPATFCRIMLLDKNSFKTQAFYQHRQILFNEESTDIFNLSDLYFHSKVVATGKPRIFSVEDQPFRVSKLEMELLFPKGISQSMIIPITIDGKTFGVVTLGESRNLARNKFGPFQLVFASLLTTIISMLFWRKENINIRKALVDSKRLIYKRLNYYESQVESFNLVSGINSRINGPLAGILASCEYIKNKKDIKKEEVEKYIDVINRNADKIHKLFRQYSEARRIINTVENHTL